MVESSFRFFESRRPIAFAEAGPSGTRPALIDTPNICRPMAIVLSSKLATLRELQTVYGLRDMYDLLEIATVDNYNAYIASKPKD